MVSDDSRRRRYFTVFPDQDLFILQPRDITALNWNLVWDSFPIYSLDAGVWRQEHWDWIQPWGPARCVEGKRPSHGPGIRPRVG